MDNLIELL